MVHKHRVEGGEMVGMVPQSHWLCSPYLLSIGKIFVFSAKSSAVSMYPVWHLMDWAPWNRWKNSSVVVVGSQEADVCHCWERKKQSDTDSGSAGQKLVSAVWWYFRRYRCTTWMSLELQISLTLVIARNVHAVTSTGLECAPQSLASSGWQAVSLECASVGVLKLLKLHWVWELLS